MKRILTFLCCLAFTASLHAGIFGSDFSISFNLAKDPRKWTHQTRLDKDGSLKFLLPGESSGTWKEMVSFQVSPTNAPLRDYVGSWKVALLRIDSETRINEETVGDDSMVINYTSQSMDDTCIQRFIKAKDGIYMLSYHVHPKLKTGEAFKIWDDIIRTATLTPTHLDEFVY